MVLFEVIRTHYCPTHVGTDNVIVVVAEMVSRESESKAKRLVWGSSCDYIAVVVVDYSGGGYHMLTHQGQCNNTHCHRQVALVDNVEGGEEIVLLFSLLTGCNLGYRIPRHHHHYYDGYGNQC